MPNGTGAEGLFFLMLMGMMGIVMFVVLIVMYVVVAVALYTMASNRGIENAWLAWIPIGNLYILGKIVGSVTISDKTIDNLEMILPIAAIVVIILGAVIDTNLFGLIYYAFSLFVLYNLYNMYKPESATLYTILSVIPFVMPFLLFSIRNVPAVDAGESVEG